jgi:hypothetical protein
MIDFNDCDGEPVFNGDPIIILEHQNHIFNNQEAVVKWNPKNGMFEFSCLDKQLNRPYDFYGVVKFRRKEKIVGTKWSG